MHVRKEAQGSIKKEPELQKKSGTECRKKGCKKESRPDLRNKSDCVQMSANCKKMNKSCESVIGEKGMSLAVDKISDKTFVNGMEVMPAQDGRGIEEEKKEVTESFLGLKNDSTMMSALSPVDENKNKSKKESIPLCEESIGNKRTMCIPEHKDSIGNNKMCIPEHNDCIGNNKKMCIPEHKDCIGNNKKICISEHKDCIGNKKMFISESEDCTDVYP